MTAPGRATLQRQLNAQAHTIQTLQDQEVRSDKKSTACFRLQAVDYNLNALGEDWEKTARRIGDAYLTAYTSFAGALEKVKQMRAAELQFFFSVLTVASSGLLSWVCEFAKGEVLLQEAADLAKLGKLSERTLSFPGYDAIEVQRALSASKEFIQQNAALPVFAQPLLKDTLAAGLGEIFSACGPVAFQSVSNGPVPQDPIHFQNRIGERVNDLKQTADHYLATVANKLAGLPAADWDSYDDNAFQSAVTRWLKAAQIFGGTDYLPDDDRMAKDLERGFWAKWMPGLKSAATVQGGTVRDDGSGVVPGEKGAYLVYPGVPSPIGDRLRPLGIIDEAGGSGGEALLAWASRFTVRPWAPAA